jgi:hypothetical protein
LNAGVLDVVLARDALRFSDEPSDREFSGMIMRMMTVPVIVVVIGHKFSARKV